MARPPARLGSTAGAAVSCRRAVDWRFPISSCACMRMLEWVRMRECVHERVCGVHVRIGVCTHGCVNVCLCACSCVRVQSVCVRARRHAASARRRASTCGCAPTMFPLGVHVHVQMRGHMHDCACTRRHPHAPACLKHARKML